MQANYTAITTKNLEKNIKC